MEAIYQVKYSGELLGMNPIVAMSRAHEVLQYVGLGKQRVSKHREFFHWYEAGNKVNMQHYS